VRVWLLILLTALVASVAPGRPRLATDAFPGGGAAAASAEPRRPAPTDRPVALPPAPAGVVALAERRPDLPGSDAEPRALLAGAVTVVGDVAAPLEAVEHGWAPWSVTAWRRVAPRARAPPA